MIDTSFPSFAKCYLSPLVSTVEAGLAVVTLAPLLAYYAARISSSLRLQPKSAYLKTLSPKYLKRVRFRI